MPIYWSHKSLPERRGRSRQERQRLLRPIRYKPFHHWQTGVAVIALPAWLAVVLAAVSTIPNTTWDGYARPLLAGFGAGIGGLLYSQFHYATLRPYLRQALESEQGAPDEPA